MILLFSFLFFFLINHEHASLQSLLLRNNISNWELSVLPVSHTSSPFPTTENAIATNPFLMHTCVGPLQRYQKKSCFTTNIILDMVCV